MLKIHSIDSLDHPDLAPYRTMRQQVEHYRARVFVAEGEKVVHRLLVSPLTLVSALMPADHFERLRPLFEQRPETVEIFLGEKAVLETLTGFSMYQGVLACAQIPPPVELDVAFARARRPRFFVAVDALSNAENLGGVIRNAAAFGVAALLVGETCAHPYLRRSVRASMGTVFDLPIVEPICLLDALRELRRRGTRCVAGDPQAVERELPAAALRDDCCVVLGSEGEGLSPGVREICDEAVAIPMQAGIDSLNVGSAAAVMFYEVWRQRRGAGRATPPNPRQTFPAGGADVNGPGQSASQHCAS